MLETFMRSLNGDRPTRLTQLGCIKIGGLGEKRTAQSGREWRPPVKQDHFTITTMRRNDGVLVPDKTLMDALKADGYADEDGKIRRIPIRLLSNSIDDVLRCRWCWYGGKTCGAFSDGESVTWNNSKTNGQKLPKPVVEKWQDSFKELRDSKGNLLFKPHGTLDVVIAAKDARWGGVYRFRTTSKITIDQLYGSLVHLSSLTYGVLVGMPLVLCVRPIQVSPDGKPTTVYVCHIELIGSTLRELQEMAKTEARFQLDMRSEMERTQRELRKLLPAPGQESDDEAHDIASEFHPEAVDPEAAPTHFDIIDGEVSEAPYRPVAMDATGIAGEQAQGVPAPAQPLPDVSTWEKFREFAGQKAQAAGVSPDQFEKCLRLAAIKLQKNGKESTISAETLKQLAERISGGSWAW